MEKVIFWVGEIVWFMNMVLENNDCVKYINL